MTRPLRRPIVPLVAVLVLLAGIFAAARSWFLNWGAPWKVGDKLWMYPPQKLSGMGHAVLMSLQPGRYLAFGTRQIGTPAQAPVDGSWSFIVEPLGPGRSRMVIRSRAAGRLCPRSDALTRQGTHVRPPGHAMDDFRRRT
jgi:hypothetical protein